MNPIIIIPSRINSKRFPRKPLVKINGIPMIKRVADKAAIVVGKENVIIATDSIEIEQVVKEKYKCIITSQEFDNGTERIAYVSNLLKLNKNQIIINIQGDEPLIDSNDIKNICKLAQDNNEIITGCSKIKDYESKNIVKLVTDKNNYLIYASRSKIPFYGKEIYKHVGIFSFRKKHLDKFLKNGKSNLELNEDVEILRFLDLKIPIKVTNVSCTQAVDIPDDVLKVEKILNNFLI